jgi:sensor histidine kinase regulating citrate/malate metabolism
MGKYEFNNNQIGAVGDGAKSESTFIMNNAIDSINLEKIKSELKEIERMLKDKANRSHEEENLLKSVEGLSEIKDKENLLSGIRSISSELFYNFSTGVGSGIVANIIYSFLTK